MQFFAQAVQQHFDVFDDDREEVYAAALNAGLTAIIEVGVGLGETTSDRAMSLLGARCLGACGLAPAAVIDGTVLGKQGPEDLMAKIEEVL